jgi:hypothetical protein
VFLAVDQEEPPATVSRNGIFNPLIGHRLQRVLRRHLSLLDFLMRAAASHERWMPTPHQRAARHARALTHWY